MDRSRIEDIKELERMLSEAEPGTKRHYAIQTALKNISNQNRYIRAMRESLLRHVRNNDVDEIKDIGEWAATHSKYQNDPLYKK
jgi:hypothetical protein